MPEPPHRVGPDLGALTLAYEANPGALLPALGAMAEPPGPADQAELQPVRAAIGRLARLPRGELRAGLEAGLASLQPARFLLWLEASGALAALLPEVHALIGFHQGSSAPQKDLWDHTLKVLERVSGDVELRWVALCHDLGKVATRAHGPGGLTFHHHEALSALYFRGIAARLDMPPEQVERVAFVIEHHARTNQYESSWTDRAVLRLVRECGEHLPLMLAFSRADWTTRRREKQAAIAAQQDELADRLASLTAPRVELPDGLSAALLAAVGLPAGPWMGQARRWVEAALERGETGSATEWAARWLAFSASTASGARAQNE